MVSGPASPSFLVQSEDQFAHLDGQRPGEAALGRRERGSKAASPSTRYPAMSRLTQAWDRRGCVLLRPGTGPAW